MQAMRLPLYATMLEPMGGNSVSAIVVPAFWKNSLFLLTVPSNLLLKNTEVFAEPVQGNRARVSWTTR